MKRSALVFILISFVVLVCSCSKDSPSGPSTPPAPHAAFTVQGDTIPPATISFSNGSTNADHYLWNFGDNATSPDTSPSHLYAAAGQFTVILIATQSSTSRSDTVSQVLNIGPAGPVGAFTFSGQTVTPATISFTNTSQNADHYQWDFGDGRTSVQENPGITYSEHGQYTVTLIAFQSSTNHSDTARQALPITPGMFFLDTVRVEQIPFTDSQGAGWDLASGPDLFFELKRGSTLLVTSSTINDLTPGDLPVRWFFQPEYRITNWSATHALDLYDYDSGSANDYIGSVSFSVNGIAGQNQYPARATLRNSQQTIRVVLVVRWQ